MAAKIRTDDSAAGGLRPGCSTVQVSDVAVETGRI